MKTKSLKRIMSFILASVFSCIMFVGCGGEKGIDETKQYVIFTVSKSRPGESVEEDKYKVDSDTLKKVQYEYDPEITYSIRADVYYTENDEPTGAYKQGTYYIHAGDKIGETTSKGNCTGPHLAKKSFSTEKNPYKASQRIMVKVS